MPLNDKNDQMQVTTASLAEASTEVGLNTPGKSNVLKPNTENINSITLDGETKEEVESFTYLDSITDEQRGSDADVKASTPFLQLKNR
ncbi:unnamed protein product [Schistosoma curassoni]|uniref:CTNNB1 binding N-teminal domain-containing protein n=1 Tax=Schistosoma curassoni TaxID=6186 RepID=A0A183K5P7_9TREM|nr:unnamed protein product [Schistosoma curassoni]